MLRLVKSEARNICLPAMSEQASYLLAAEDDRRLDCLESQDRHRGFAKRWRIWRGSQRCDTTVEVIDCQPHCTADADSPDCEMLATVISLADYRSAKLDEDA